MKRQEMRQKNHSRSRQFANGSALACIRSNRARGCCKRWLQFIGESLIIPVIIAVKTQFKNLPRKSGFTIAEMVVCFTIITLVIGGTMTAYNRSALFTERAGYQLAAQAQAVQQFEHVRAALWDTMSTPPVDNTTNFSSFINVAILELPISGTNVIYATNYLTVSTITVTNNPPTYVKLVQVDTFWPWNGVTMSNVMVAYRAPDE
jgi:hypothetical protein